MDISNIWSEIDVIYQDRGINFLLIPKMLTGLLKESFSEYFKFVPKAYFSISESLFS